MPSHDNNFSNLAFLGRPIPEQIQREAALCQALDGFEALLAPLEEVRSSAGAHALRLPQTATGAELRAAFVVELIAIQTLLDQIDRHGRDLLKAAKVALALE
jgi:hypothetical protein